MLNWAKENRIKLLAVAIVIIVILAIYCMLILQFPKNQLLTDNELRTLITKKGIEPTLINPIGDSYTVILYKNVDNIGTSGMMAYKNWWGKIKTKPFGYGSAGPAGKMDIVFWSSHPVSYNLIGYIGVEIINKEICDTAKSVKVVLNNGLVESANFKDSPFLFIPATKKYFWEKPVIATIEVYDENGTVIDGFYTNMEFYLKSLEQNRGD